MLRSEIVDAANRLAAALELSGIEEVLDSMLEGPPDSRRRGGSEAIFTIFQKYQHEYGKFTAAERRLIDIFGLTPLSEPGW
jgi:hypothetical protein